MVIKMNKTILKKYARLVVRMGVNIKKGQGALIMAETDQAEFALLVAEEAYRAGAKWVDMRWTNQSFTKLQLKKESLKTLSNTPEWEKMRMQQQVEELPVRIWIESEDPDGLKGVNVEKMQKANRAHEGEKAVPRRDGQQAPVDDRRGAEREVGEEGFPRAARERGGAEAVGGDQF